MANDIGKQFMNKIGKKLQRAANKISSRSAMKNLAEDGVELIRKRVRAGRGVKTAGGVEKKFKRLAKSTIESRRRKRLHPKTSPGKSNLTETGQMIDSMKAKSAGRGGAKIVFEGTRRSNGKRISNKELASIHDKQGASKKRVKRPFFRFSGKEIKKLTKQVERELKRLIKI